MGEETGSGGPGVFVYMCMFLICMSVYVCGILVGRQGDSNYICVYVCTKR